jgi:hypothetical protein
MAVPVLIDPVLPQEVFVPAAPPIFSRAAAPFVVADRGVPCAETNRNVDLRLRQRTMTKVNAPPSAGPDHPNAGFTRT